MQKQELEQGFVCHKGLLILGAIFPSVTLFPLISRLNRQEGMVLVRLAA